jgi:hypothetical protein
MGAIRMAETPIEDKNHAYREPATENRLVVVCRCPYNEAIIDENRIESALRAAFAVPDLQVTAVQFEVSRRLTSEKTK